MKIAIGICGKTSGRCSSMGCFKAYNSIDKHFAIYKEEGIETELLSFFSCNLCFEKRQDEENNGEEKLKSYSALKYNYILELFYIRRRFIWINTI